MGLQIQPLNLNFIDSNILGKHFNQIQARDDEIDKLDLIHIKLVGDVQKGFFCPMQSAKIVALNWKLECVYIYVYIYVEREREANFERNHAKLVIYLF
jgi:hypothetical protein